MTEPVRYVDRATGEVRQERVFGEGGLRFAYGDGLPGRAVRALLRRRATSRAYGLWQRSRLSRGGIARFIEVLGIDASEAERPLADFRSLDDFFTRALKPGARPWVEDPALLPSPCEARVFAYERVDELPLLPVKGASVPLAGLLRDEGLAARFRGGPVCVLRLAPADYHRFHFPDAGTPGPARRIPGALDSVHPIALLGGARPFLSNQRDVTIHESEGFGGLALVEVGAALVGTIVQTYRPGRRAARGEEKGMFRFGGSTVILCAEPGRVAWDADLLANTARGLETLVRLGTRIGRRP